MDEQQRQVVSGAATLQVSEWGSAHDSAVVALHPGIGDSRIWQWCAPTWAEAGHHVIAYDRRGFGRTQWVPEHHDELADLRAVVDATGADPAIVVGNSMGGGLALDYALAHPASVRGLVLLAPSASGYDYSRWVEVPAEVEQDAAIAEADERGDIAEVNRLELRYWLDGVDQNEGRVSGKPRELLREMNDVALRAGPVGESAPRPEVWDRLDEISAPTLVLVGAYDLPGFGPQCAALVDELADAQLVVLPNSAHCPSLDDPEELDRHVLDFLAAVGS